LVAKYFAIPAPNSTAMSQFLLQTWKNTGLPEFILSDNGPENKGSVENLLVALDVKRVKSRARSPESRGIIERVFRSFSDFEVPLLLKHGVGFRMSLEELNMKLKEWLISEYNERPARLSRTVGV
jgi:transposase InsO family protein